MSISLHFVLAVALVATAILTVVGATKQLRTHALLRLVTLASALLLVPTNMVLLIGSAPRTPAAWAVTGSVAALVVQLVLLLVGLRTGAQVTKARRVLAVAAHSDDLGAAAAGTLARLAGAGHEVHTLVLGTDKGKDGLRLPDAVDHTVIGLPGEHLTDFDSDVVEAIATKIRDLNPDIIITHARDADANHGVVHRATRRAAPQHPAVLYYETPFHELEMHNELTEPIQLRPDQPASSHLRVDDPFRKPTQRPTPYAVGAR